MKASAVYNSILNYVQSTAPVKNITTEYYKTNLGFLKNIFFIYKSKVEESNLTLIIKFELLDKESYIKMYYRNINLIFLIIGTQKPSLESEEIIGAANIEYYYDSILHNNTFDVHDTTIFLKQRTLSMKKIKPTTYIINGYNYFNYNINVLKFTVLLNSNKLAYLNTFGNLTTNMQFLLDILLFKNKNFMYKFYNKLAYNSKLNFPLIEYNNIDKPELIDSYHSTANYFKLKNNLIYILNPSLLSLGNALKKSVYYKNRYGDVNVNIKYILKKISIKWIQYELHNKYLFIFWFIQKIWFKLFNTFYIRYIYNFKSIKKYTSLINLTRFVEILKKYNSYFNFNSPKKKKILLLKTLNTFIRLKKFITTLKTEGFKLKSFFKFIYTTAYFNSLIATIEKTLLFYNNKNIIYLLIPNIFLFVKPFITSAKLVSDYLYFKLRKKLTINVAYNKIRKWQVSERSLVSVSFRIRSPSNFTRSHAATFKKQLFANTFFRNSIDFRSPLRGIRCVCSGPPYKAKRKLRTFYHIWVANFHLTGWMPLQQFNCKIDYYQTFIILKRATIGLKVWVLLESYIVLK